MNVKYCVLTFIVERPNAKAMVMNMNRSFAILGVLNPLPVRDVVAGIASAASVISAILRKTLCTGLVVKSHEVN